MNEPRNSEVKLQIDPALPSTPFSDHLEPANSSLPRLTFSPPEQSLAEKHGIEKRYPAIVRYCISKAGLSLEERLAGYNAEKEGFEAALKLWQPEDAAALRDYLEATRFIDYADQAVDIVDAYRSRGQASIFDQGIQYRYNRNGIAEDPEFQNMQRVNQFLKSTDLPPGVERLVKVHAIAMAGGVDDLDGEYVGRLRDYAVVGEEYGYGITDKQLKQVKDNPYLDFWHNRRYNRRSEKTGRHYGEIVYPDPVSIKTEGLRRIEYFDREVFWAVRAFQSLSSRIQELERDSETPAYKELTKALVIALLEERYLFHGEQIERHAGFETPKDVRNFIRAASDLKRAGISIHGLPDGNGRCCTAEMINSYFDDAGISRPRQTDPNRDILLSEAGHAAQVERGMLNTAHLYNDIAERIKLSLRIENSPELLLPDVNRDVGISLKTRGRKRVAQNVSLQAIDGKQVGAYIDVRLSEDRALERQFRKNPVPVIEKLRGDYKQFAKDHLLYAHIPKKGQSAAQRTELTSVSLVDNDFRSLFGVPLAADTTLWQAKMDRWYRQDQLVWRGMCDDEVGMTDQDMLRLFQKLDFITLCNNLTDYYDSSQEQLVEWALDEFDIYNREVVSGDLSDTIYEHITEGDRYETTYALSTSKNRATGARFAWGWGKFGYSADEVKAKQSTVKSRVLIAGYPAMKDVDATRQKFFDGRFSDEHGRQEEVCVIGGWDPDAIMFMGLLDARRRTTECMVRNPQSPNEAWHLIGDFKPGKDLLADVSEHNVINRLPILDGLPEVFGAYRPH